MVSLGQEFKHVLVGQYVLGVSDAIVVTSQLGLQPSEGLTEAGGSSMADPHA